MNEIVESTPTWTREELGTIATFLEVGIGHVEGRILSCERFLARAKAELLSPYALGEAEGRLHDNQVWARWLRAALDGLSK